MEKNNGFSFLEMTIVIAIIGIISVAALPRLRDSNNENKVKKDVTLFTNAIGQAQSSASSGASRGCAAGDRLKQVSIEGISPSGFSMVSYCTSDTLSPTANTPTPLPAVRFNVESSVIQANPYFATFMPNAQVTVIPGVTIRFSRDANECTATMNSAGVISLSGSACP